MSINDSTPPIESFYQVKCCSTKYLQYICCPLWDNCCNNISLVDQSMELNNAMNNVKRLANANLALNVLTMLAITGIIIFGIYCFWRRIGSTFINP
jgi:uncharacterized iron-regulated membrane protein